MNRVSKMGLAVALGVLSLQAFAAGNAEVGRTKAMYCATCHGTSGEREIALLRGGTSKLGGMAPDKFVSGMQGYRDGSRFHPLMQFFVMPLRNEDIEDLAAYYATLGPSLYQRLGGKDAINAVVKDLLATSMQDARLAPRMSKLNAARCEGLLTDLLCEATGGPCKYTGRDMKTAHTGHNVTEAEWQGFAESLMKVLDRFNMPAREREELLQLVVPMKKDIVGL